MSLETTITNFSNITVDNYIKTISSKYDINLNDLIESWNNVASGNKQGSEKTTDTTKSDKYMEFNENMTSEFLLKLKKDELQYMCQRQKKRYTGTKVQLVEYLLNKTVEPVKQKKTSNDTDTKLSSTTEVPVTTKPSVDTKLSSRIIPDKTVSSIKEDDKKPKLPILSMIKKNTDRLVLRKNNHGYYIHRETGFVFDTDRNVCGKETGDNGVIEQLSKSDIDECKMRKFKYIIPVNLDTTDATYGSDEEIDDDIASDDDNDDRTTSKTTDNKSVSDEDDIVEEELLDDCCDDDDDDVSDDE